MRGVRSRVFTVSGALGSADTKVKMLGIFLFGYTAGAAVFYTMVAKTAPEIAEPEVEQETEVIELFAHEEQIAKAA